jgi:excisionase family DNA binding protein
MIPFVCIKIKLDMEKTVLISLSVDDLQTLIIDCVNACLRHNKQEKHESLEPERLLTVTEAAEFLSLTVPTIYSKVSKNELPVMKRNNRLYFSTEELREYLKGGKRLTNEQIEEKANEYITKKKKD